MSQAPTQHHATHGEDLLRELRQGWSPLPFRTLVAMAMGGLKVRMTRSAVTMLSVVLAIAFLTYSGLGKHITGNIVMAMTALEDAEGVAPDKMETATASIAALDPFAAMPLDEQRQLARELGMDEVAAQQQELITLDASRRTALGEQEKAQADGRTLEAQNFAEQVAKLDDQIQALQEQIAFGQWVGSNRPADAGQDVKLREALTARYRAIVGNMTMANRLSEDELDVLESRFLPMAERAEKTAEADTLRLGIDKERKTRDAAEIRTRLKAAGVNVQKVLAEDYATENWLAAMALLTCVVGIANAMLMSVTERYREIGTMKCLGAVDGLVVKLFLIESGFMGVIGGVLGIILGFIVALIASALQYGSYGLSHFPLGGSLVVIFWAVIFGILLSVLGAAGPAWQASRMKPVDALRVDE